MSNTTPRPAGETSMAKEILRAIVHILLKNWGFKLLALLLAVVLWSGLITQDPNLTREKVFSDVSISVTGTESIKRNGFIVVSDLKETLGEAFLRVDVPQMQYQNAQASTFNVRIDLSRITETGLQDVRVLTSNSSIYGSVSEVQPSTVQLEVEEYVTRYRIPANIATVGKAPEGYYAGTASIDPPIVTVSGPRSLVEKITRAEAVLDLSKLPAREGLLRTALTFQLLDEEGKAIESDLLEVTSQSVLVDSLVVEQYMYATKSMQVADIGLVSGKPEDGYEIKSVSYMPETVTAAARSMNLDALDTLYTNSSVDVTGRRETFQAQVRVRRPSELIYLSADTITVTVEIGPVIGNRVFEQQVQVTGLADNLRADLSQRKAAVTVSGPVLWLQELKNNSVRLTVDAAGLEAGSHELMLNCQVEGPDDEVFTVEMNPETITVNIVEK